MSLRYGLRNSLGAMVTVVAVNIGYLIGGTVVIETVFQIPGLGSLLVQSALQRDYTLVTALTLVAGVAVVAISLAYRSHLRLPRPQSKAQRMTEVQTTVRALPGSFRMGRLVQSTVFRLPSAAFCWSSSWRLPSWRR